MRWIPPTPSASALMLGSFALALASQSYVSAPGVALASAALILTLASYGRLYSSLPSRVPRPDAPAMVLALAPYALALALRGALLLPWYAAPALAFATYLSLSARGLGRSPAGLTAGALSLALLSTAFSGIMGRPRGSAWAAALAWSSFAAFGVLLVESRVPSRNVKALYPLASIALGALSSALLMPSLALAFVEPLFLSLRTLGSPIAPHDLPRLGRRLALSSAIFLAISVAV
ncbi:MAG: hypothetical protein ACP5GT_04390, partial [Conexivisphaera sp.]